MLLSITTTHTPATELGYLLAKHPDKAQSFELAYGAAHVFYPRADHDACTACLLLDIDPIGLVRGRDRRRGKDEGTLAQYVNDRPYVASSFLSVAIAQVFGSALKGSCRDRPELVGTALPLEVVLAAVSIGGKRGLGAKRSLAQREYALGLEALQRFVEQEPLYRVHECVFGVLALESTPVDPRL
jgi:hypothetical protein